VEIQYNENGLPTKSTIIRLVTLYGLDWQLFTFNDGYGENKSVMYYREKSLNKPFGKFIDFLNWAGVEVETHKIGENINSIWFKKRNFEH